MILQSWVFLLGGVIECYAARNRAVPQKTVNLISKLPPPFNELAYTYLITTLHTPQINVPNRLHRCSFIRGFMSIVFSTFLVILGMVALAQQVYIAKDVYYFLFAGFWLLIGVLALLQTLHGLYEIGYQSLRREL